MVAGRTAVSLYQCRSRSYSDFIIFLGCTLLHALCVISLLDVYFSTTIVENVRPVQWSTRPDARRLVLFVSDGLRADKFFELDERESSRTPFLRHIIATNGAWGVSHTKAPTESRPAHIAMLGGFYEDPSAIKKKFQKNLVEFDTVLNESRETWSYGGFDVIPFFNKGSAADHVHAISHRYHLSRMAELDEWVLVKLRNLLKQAAGNGDLRTRLSNDKIIFFLHLAGVDSNGHAFHPRSRQYMDNIREVDDIVKSTVALFESFYGNDSKTAYLFTGDHGMTDSGGHGGSHPNETRTPFIAWGPGINRNERVKEEVIRSESEIAETKKWGLDPFTRHDIQEVDISILMSSLIGVPFPVNSIGKLPLHYLSTSHATAEKAFGRAEQVVETLKTKKRHIKHREFHLLFWQFHSNEDEIIADKVRCISASLDKKQYDTAIAESADLTKFARDALEYYHNFSSYVPFASIVLSVVGFAIFAAFKWLSSQRDMQHPRRNAQVCLCAGVVLLVLCYRLYSFDSKWIYYAYMSSPIVIWCLILPYLKNPKFIPVHFTLLIFLVVCTVILWILFMIGGFYYRQFFTIVVLSLCLLPANYGFKNHKIGLIWILLCVCLSAFPLLPEVTSVENNKAVILAAGVGGSLFSIAISKYHKSEAKTQNSLKMKVSQIIYVLCISLPGIFTISLYLFSMNENAAFFLAVASWVVPFLYPPGSFRRLTAFNGLHTSLYLLISVSYDSVFFVVFNSLLHLWVIAEAREPERDDILVTWNVPDCSKPRAAAGRSRAIAGDLRIVCVLVSFLLVAFFGLYSVQSLNHFRPSRLPFMPVTKSSHLLLWFFYKLFLHELSTVLAYCTIATRRKLSVKSHWYLVSVFLDIMLAFFYSSVKTSGSWAEMGFSVINVCIAAGLPIILVFLLFVAKLAIAMG